MTDSRKIGDQVEPLESKTGHDGHHAEGHPDGLRLAIGIRVVLRKKEQIVHKRHSTPEARVLLLVRQGCHLCDEARDDTLRVIADYGVDLVERDVDADPNEAARYGEQVPVLFVDGVQLDFWRISESRLRAALASPPGTQRS
jgi:glutaredoxin